MKLKKNIATGADGFVFNPATGDSFSCNAVAADILNAMKDSSTAEQIKNKLLDKYDVSTTQLERDWEDWMIQLKETSLLDV